MLAAEMARSVILAVQGCAKCAHDIGSSTTIAVAFGSAVLGAAIALVGDLVARWTTSRRYFRNVLRATILELEFVASEASRRAAAAPGIRRDAPLPTDAWRGLLSSTELQRLDSRLLSQTAAVYRSVEAANYIAAQSPTYLMIATATTDSLMRDTYRSEAARAASEPFAPIADPAAKAAAELRGLLGKQQ
jgi:hypothetical protein